MALISPAIAADANKDKLRPEPPKLQADATQTQMAKAWSLFYGGKHEEAAKLVEPLTKADKEAVRVEASHCFARCAWAIGPPARAKANEIWGGVRKSTLNANIARQKIAKALTLAADGNVPKAVELLQDAVKAGLSDTCTAEAAIEIAALQVRTRQFDEAEKTLRTAIEFLQSKAMRAETPEACTEPFIAAAKAAIDHLKYDREGGRLEFEQAEKLRREDKFEEASKLYSAVMKQYRGVLRSTVENCSRSTATPRRASANAPNDCHRFF